MAIVPQEHTPGAEAEVDFGEFWIDLAGVRTQVFIFVFRMCHSGKNVQRYYNPGLSVAGISVNQREERTVGGAAWLGELRAAAGGRGLRLIGRPIPKRVVIADATEAARGLGEWGSAEATALGAIYAEHLAAIEGDPS